jgi:type VI protein secretion system component VasK
MKLTREPAERPSPPPPLEADDVLVVRVITAGWAVALVVLLIVRGSLPAGERWWVWTCVAGLALGIFALWYMPRIKRGRARAAAGRSGEDGDGDDSEAAPPQSAPRDSDSNTVSSTETPGRSTRS